MNNDNKMSKVITWSYYMTMWWFYDDGLRLDSKPMMMRRRKRIWWIWDRLRRAWWRGLASGANEADFLELILGPIIFGWNITETNIRALSRSWERSPVETQFWSGQSATKMGRSVHWGITRDAWTPGLKNGPKMSRKKGTKNRAATIRCSNGANSWCRRIYNEDPRHLCHINHPPSNPLFLCFQRKTATTGSVFVRVYSTASKICTVHIILPQFPIHNSRSI